MSAVPAAPRSKVLVTLRGDAAPLMACIAGVAAASAQPTQRFREAVDALLGLPDLGQQLVAVEPDRGAAAGTGEVVVTLQPSDRLRGLLAAGARDVD